MPSSNDLLARHRLEYRYEMPAKKQVKRSDHQKLTIYLPPKIIEEAKLLAVVRRQTYSAVIEGFVVDGLASAKEK